MLQLYLKKKLENWDLDLFKWREIINSVCLQFSGFKFFVLSSFLHFSSRPKLLVPKEGGELEFYR